LYLVGAMFNENCYLKNKKIFGGDYISVAIPNEWIIKMFQF